mgnify:CR=1 FL=1
MSDTPNNGHCQQNLRRVVISSLIGAVIEWYDFFLYGVVAGIVFNKIYFPDFDPTVGTVLAFATFAVGSWPVRLGVSSSATSVTSWAARRCWS